MPNDNRRYRMDRDKILLRAKDITLIISVLTMLGLLLGPVKQFIRIQAVADDVIMMKQDMRATIAQTNANTTAIAVVSTQYESISKQLESIQRDVRVIKFGRNRGDDDDRRRP